MTSETKHVVRFLVATFVLSWIAMGYVIMNGGIRYAGPLMLLIMWIPGLVSLSYRAITKIGFRDVGWKRGEWKFWALALFIPFVAATIAYTIYWTTGISEFQSIAAEKLARYGAESSAVFIAKMFPLSLLIGCFGALGEEIGWRGFLIPKLYGTTVKYPLAVSALIWGVWHFPLILWGGYATSSLPVVSALLFTVDIVAAGIFVGWLRMRSGSVWAAMMFHAAHNMFLQTAFEVFNKPGPLSEFLGGESGVIPCAVYISIFTLGYFTWTKARTVS